MPNEKFVAFVDILGFKQIALKSNTAAQETITKFSSIIYQTWKSQRLNVNYDINGFIVSDCAIIHTIDSSPESLSKLFHLLETVFATSVFKNGLMLRCAITKGPYDELPSHGFESLTKRLIVGTAYVNATILEEKFKGANIVFGEDVYSIIPEIVNTNYTVHKISKDSEEEKFYSFQWANVEDFIQEDNLSAFIDLANQSKWLPHYYETIHLFLKSISNARQKEAIWNQIFECLLKKEQIKPTNFNNIDTFIINAFSENIDYNYKKMIARYLRDRIKDRR